MEQKKLFLVANPKSGKARVKYELLQIVTVLSEAGYSVTVYPTKCRGDATNAVKALTDEYDTIVCCGGDGTLNEVISGIMHNPLKKDFKLGYIPLGTLNEWSSGLNISRDIKKAANDVVTGRVMPLDIGRFDDSYFVYTASFGAFTSASYSAPQEVKNVLGQAAYFFEGIKSLSAIKPIPLKFDIDGETVEGNFLFGAVSNSLSMGGVIKLDPKKVEFDDGIFEIVLIDNPENLIEFQDIIDALIKRDFNRKRIQQYKASSITVYGSENINWTLDGEMAQGQKEIKIENIHRAINFIIP